jgi:hypothetical protein
MALTSVFVTGCAYRRADRSLVQPLAFSKKQFTGEWFYMKTVYEAPYESGYFTGQGGWPMGTRIRFEVTERYLYAFNASPNVRKTESEVTPVAAWPISRHFDIKPRLNFATGEPSNVIVEESFDGIPWYQRKYMRVHWESSVISDFMNIGETLNKWWMRGAWRDEAARYVPPEKVEFQPEYMTFVVDRVVTHMLRSFYSMWLSEIPPSSFRVRMRHAFMRVPAETGYTPKEYNDYMLSKFGVFRTNVVRFQPDRGLVDWSYKFYANRHNIASQADIDAGDTVKPRKIIYYLSPNWPTDLRDAVIQVGKEWNTAMAYALKRKETDENGHNAVFEVLPNAWKEGSCDRAKMWECTFEKTKVRREVGDMRYNVLWWINEPQTGSPLGYGPSFADPDSGRIIVGTAYVYGAGFRRIIDNFMTLYDLMTGRYTDQDVLNGTEYFNSVFRLNGHDHLIGVSGDNGIKNNPGIAGITKTGMMAPKIRLNTMSKLMARIKSPQFMSRMMNVRKLDNSTITSRLSKFETNPRAKSHLMSDFVAQMAFPFADPTTTMNSVDPLVKQRLQANMPNNFMKPHNLQKLVQEYMRPAKFNMFMADYADPILNSFVQWHVQNKTPRDEVRKSMLNALFIYITAHEVGHTLGLMHNFRGSTDEYNFHSAYHDLKDGKTPTSCGLSKDHSKCDPSRINTNIKEADGKTPVARRFYRNASVMDYHGDVVVTGHSGGAVGKTDQAALAFIYGGLVEQAVDDPRKQGALIKWDMTVERRNQDPSDKLKLRPFRYCSDYAMGQDPFCMVWDAGHKATQIVDQIILNYDRLYPLNYWRRGRRNFGPNYAIGRNIRAFQHLSIIYQDLAYRITTQPGYEKTEDFKDKLAAVQKGFAFFMRIMAQPAVGLHEKDQIDGVWKTRPTDPDETAPKIDVKIGEGRFFFSDIQDGYWGTARFRFNRVGALFDKWITMQLMSVRSWGYYNNNINWLYTNFYDLFPQDTTDMFSQIISDVWNPNSPLLYRKCEVDTQGQCKKDANGKTITRVIEPATHPIIQINGMIYALALLNNPFHDNTFENNMLVGLKGNGSSWTPPGSGTEVKCPPLNNFTGQFQCGDANTQLVCFNNFHNTRTYFAVKSKSGVSISHNIVQRACELGNQLAVLRKQGARRTFIERKQGELESLETMLTIMKLYTSLFSGG